MKNSPGAAPCRSPRWRGRVTERVTAFTASGVGGPLFSFFRCWCVILSTVMGVPADILRRNHLPGKPSPSPLGLINIYLWVGKTPEHPLLDISR